MSEGREGTQTIAFLQDDKALLHQRGTLVATLLGLLHDLKRATNNTSTVTPRQSPERGPCTNLVQGHTKELALGALLPKQTAHHRCPFALAKK
mgnify:CR=1 FL=1